MKQSSVTREHIKGLFTTFQDLIVAYREKPISLSDSEWFASQYHGKFPNLSEREAAELGNITVSSVARFQSTLKEVINAAASGRSKEQWFSGEMRKEIEGLELNEAGERLQILDQAFIAGNDKAISGREIDVKEDTMFFEVPQIEPEPQTAREQWNPFTIKETLLNIGQNAGLAGLLTMAVPGVFDFSSDALEEVQNVSDMELQLSTESEKLEQMKTLLTAALKISSDLGKLPFLPKSVSVDTIGNLASHGVEYYIALSDFSAGRKTLMQAMNHVGMSGMAAVYNIFSSEGIKNISTALLSQIPIVGPILGNIVGAIVSISVDRRIHEKIKLTLHKAEQKVRAAVNTVWEKIKTTGQKIKEKIKSFCNWLFV